jgi:hypothetical protein
MRTNVKRTCPSCGVEFSGEMEFCPVCMLRNALGGGVKSGESSFEEAVKPAPDQLPKRFEHFELLTSEDGKPVELGRGAMGVTYKALDINLHSPVTLKVISERYLADESARLRFLRRPARRRASITRMSPRFFTSEEPATVISMRWNSWREKRSKISSNAPVAWR